MKFALALIAAAPIFAQPPDPLQALLDNRTGDARKAVGIAAGVIDEKGRTIYVSGRASASGKQAPNADSIFEIGSITKVFTSLLLADMVERGEVKLDDPVAKYLPEELKVPAWEDRPITLLDLSMQVSGLPRMPNNFKPSNLSNPYADYGPKQLYEFLAGYKLTRAPGEKYDYSNLGVGLLGHALSRKVGVSYEELVKTRILQPLGMKSTSITLEGELRDRVSPGHSADLKPVPHWDLDAMAGAGALRSSVNDMLTFLSAALGFTDTPLAKAFARLREKSLPAGSAGVKIAMGWHIFTRNGELIWHNGGTGGYRSFAGFDPKLKRGAVVLCNTNFSVDDLGRHFVDPRYPAEKLPSAKPAVKLEGSTLDEYVGEYKLTPAFSLKITRDGEKLMAQATGQQNFEIFAEKKDVFFYRVVQATVTFTRDGSGKVNGLVLRQNGVDAPAARVQ